MKQLPNYGDVRQSAHCAYCGGGTETRDHIPSRVLLDEPYPDNLPIVPACRNCNVGFSVDEEYLACLIECVCVGSVFSSEMQREKVEKILFRKPALAKRLSAARTEIDSATHFAVEEKRLRNVVFKLACGHALFELNEPQYEDPTTLDYAPLSMLSDEARSRFERLSQTHIFPEVGSRAMQRLMPDDETVLAPRWIVVQPGRYRYVAFVGDSVVVRIVLSEYLACEIVW